MKLKPKVDGIPLVSFFVIAGLVFPAVSLAQSHQNSMTRQTIACRVLEAEESTRYGVRLVIFHYRDDAERAKLGALLRKDDGATVEFQSPGGKWRPATVLRLRICFGRGLLVYRLSRAARRASPALARRAPANGSVLARGDVFFVRFP